LRWKNSLAIPVIALLLVVAIGMLLIGYIVNDRVFYTALEEREKDKANSIRFATQSILDAEVRKLSTFRASLRRTTGSSRASTNTIAPEGTYARSNPPWTISSGGSTPRSAS